MQRPLLTLLVLAVLVSSAFAASVFQLDVCNKHRTVSEAPGTSLTFTKVRFSAAAMGQTSMGQQLQYQHPSAAAVCCTQLLGMQCSCFVHYCSDKFNINLSIMHHEPQGLLQGSVFGSATVRHPVTTAEQHCSQKKNLQSCPVHTRMPTVQTHTHTHTINQLAHADTFALLLYLCWHGCRMACVW